MGGSSSRVASGGRQLPTTEVVGLSVDSRASRSHRKAPRSFRSKKGLSQVAFCTGVGAARSTSPTSGLADGQPVHPRTSAPDGRVFSFMPESYQASALPPTPKWVAFRAVTAVSARAETSAPVGITVSRAGAVIGTRRNWEESPHVTRLVALFEGWRHPSPGCRRSERRPWWRAIPGTTAVARFEIRYVQI